MICLKVSFRSFERKLEVANSVEISKSWTLEKAVSTASEWQSKCAGQNRTYQIPADSHEGARDGNHSAESLLVVGHGQCNSTSPI